MWHMDKYLLGNGDINIRGQNHKRNISHEESYSSRSWNSKREKVSPFLVIDNINFSSVRLLGCIQALLFMNGGMLSLCNITNSGFMNHVIGHWLTSASHLLWSPVYAHDIALSKSFRKSTLRKWQSAQVFNFSIGLTPKIRGDIAEMDGWLSPESGTPKCCNLQFKNIILWLNLPQSLSSLLLLLETLCSGADLDPA